MWKKFSRQPPKDFLDWLKNGCPRGPYDQFPSLDGWRDQSAQIEIRSSPVEVLVEGYRAAAIEAGRNNAKLKFLRNSDHPLRGSDVQQMRRVGSLHVYDLQGTQFELSDAEIGDIIIHTLPTVCRLTRCKIGRLTLMTQTNIELRECWIEEFILTSHCTVNFSARGGGFLNIECPTPPNNPFTGPVEFARNVFLPRTRAHGLKTAQPYSSLRVHLTGIGNVAAASVFQRAELAFERQDDTPTNRIIGWLYWLGSDYGTSTGRPLLLALGFFGLAVVLLVAFDGVAGPVTSEVQGQDWRQVLIGGDWPSRTGRALVYAFQSVFNPLGIFGTRGLLVVREVWLAASVTVLTFFSTVSLFLFGLALRRRFRLG